MNHGENNGVETGATTPASAPASTPTAVAAAAGAAPQPARLAVLCALLALAAGAFAAAYMYKGKNANLPGAAQPAPGGGAGPLAIAPARLHLGKIRQFDTKPFEFTLRNTGKSPLKIVAVSKSCGCTEAAVRDETIPPGGETVLSGALAAQDRVERLRTLGNGSLGRDSGWDAALAPGDGLTCWEATNRQTRNPRNAFLRGRRRASRTGVSYERRRQRERTRNK